MRGDGAWPAWSVPGRFLSFLSWSGAAATVGPWGRPAGGDRESSDESSVRPGRDNSIYVTRHYFQQFSCTFDLQYYPFDTQVSFFRHLDLAQI